MKTILVVEDTLELREEICELLELEEFNVLAAKNGEEGLKLAKHNLPDLILSDIMMPKMNGYEMLVELKKDYQTRLLPIVFLTAKSTFQDIRKGMEFGAEDYLPKPVQPDVLLKAIHSQIEKHEHIEKRFDDLITNISGSLPHEMRTPLNQIIGFASLLMQPDLDYETEEVKRMASYIFDGGNRLLHTIENHLLYSELKTQSETQAGIQSARNELPQDLFYLITEKCYQVARKYNRQEDLEVSCDQFVAKISSVHFTKLVEELVDNAFKFSVSGQKVSVRTNSPDGNSVLRISNVGQMMTEEHLAAIGAFMQFDRDVKEQQGSGLGLAIVQQIVQLYGGDFKFETEDKNLIVLVQFRN